MKRRGSVLMEFIIVAPLMLILVSMILQFAQIWIAREITAYAAYCACRSVLSANGEEAENGAKRAAELACSWMCLVGLPSSVNAASPGTAEMVNDMPKFHDREDIATTETVYFDDGSGISGEVRIPGWGAIPGSDSAERRVKTKVEYIADSVVVKVEFAFPLMLPLAGRMISWFVNSESDNVDLGHTDSVDYGSHELSGGNKSAWQGEEMVMDADGNLIERKDADWGKDGRFPAIILTEWCILPRMYSGKSLLTDAYAPKYPFVGGDS